MKPFGSTDFQHIRDAIELTVLGALRLTQLFTPALAESRGGRERELDGARHSQERYGSYKSPSPALLAMSQSLATELVRRHPVNSVAPATSGATP